MIEDFKKIYEDRHRYALEWKEKNPDGKILGYMCSYIPEEIFYAAGVLPVRVLGSHEPQNVTEPHIFGMYCPHSRDVLAQGLQGRYEYLDAVGTAYPCMHMTQAFDAWTLHVTPQYFFVDMPNRVQSSHALRFYAGVLSDLKKRVEKWLGKEISDEELREAIEIYNENRRLLRQLYDLRKDKEVPITGLESMHVTVANLFMDKKDSNRMLKELIEKELPGRKVKPADVTRLMILGSENDDMKFIEMVESFDAVIVVDDHCTGSRYFWNPVEIEGDLIESLAQRYVERPPCPQRDYPERVRKTHLVNLAKGWSVEGVIALQQKFCDPHELDKVAVLGFFKEADIPTLYLELDVTVPVGQFKIRVEAFLERLREEDLW